MTDAAFGNPNARDYFDGAAPGYDVEVQYVGWAGNTVLQAALRELPVQPRRVLDLGAGTGLTAAAIIEVADPEFITAVDFSGAMLACLRERLGDRPGLQIITTSVEEYMSADEQEPSYDLIAMIGVMPLIQKHRLVLSGIARRLHPDGRAMFTYDPVQRRNRAQWKKRTEYDNDGRPFPTRRYSPREMHRAMGQSGLTVVSDMEFQSQPSGDTRFRTRFVVAQRQTAA